MRALLAIALLLYTDTVTTGQLEAWQILGAPCTTQTDIKEGTCNLKVKTKPRWK
jgi:hypothetical protein